ncbi:hypothetical protein F503_04037 [Ophiostoma piceae UAMH 11346]|uniref:Uncharacterized protein n=1 Tax=Ophiostoma piceae (strain UAMH 11346) TaxID=1262450 RepID=S3C919_OPHP1|nr:hypothetical protein F503_04037 [Ophiostoma piceae UAMH 11346]
MTSFAKYNVRRGALVVSAPVTAPAVTTSEALFIMAKASPKKRDVNAITDTLPGGMTATFKIFSIDDKKGRPARHKRHIDPPKDYNDLLKETRMLQNILDASHDEISDLSNPNTYGADESHDKSPDHFPGDIPDN